MNFEGNPFFWGFSEQRSIVTLAKRANATYNEPRETVETIPSHPHPTEEDDKVALKTHFFDQNFATSPNPAFVTGTTPIEPIPYLPPVDSSNEETTDDCEEKEEETTEKETI